VCAIVLLRGRGMSAEAIAARLGVHERTVVRWGTPGWAPRRGGRPPAPCGTRAARKRYRRNDEECGPCAEVGVNSRPIRGTTEDSARGWAA
jgi:hypothetical protein